MPSFGRSADYVPSQEVQIDLIGIMSSQTHVALVTRYALAMETPKFEVLGVKIPDCCTYTGSTLSLLVYL